MVSSRTFSLEVVEGQLGFNPAMATFFFFSFIFFLLFGFLLFILTADPVSFARFLRKRISSIKKPLKELQITHYLRSSKNGGSEVPPQSHRTFLLLLSFFELSDCAFILVPGFLALQHMKICVDRGKFRTNLKLL